MVQYSKIIKKPVSLILMRYIHTALKESEKISCQKM